MIHIKRVAVGLGIFILSIGLSLLIAWGETLWLGWVLNGQPWLFDLPVGGYMLAVVGILLAPCLTVLLLYMAYGLGRVVLE